MKISLVQDQAITARMAAVVGADNFDRLFRGIQFDEFDGNVLYVYAADEYRAAEIEDTFALNLATAPFAVTPSMPSSRAAGRGYNRCADDG